MARMARIVATDLVPAVERQDREHGLRELHGRASAAERVEVAALGELPELLGDVQHERLATSRASAPSWSPAPPAPRSASPSSSWSSATASRAND